MQHASLSRFRIKLCPCTIAHPFIQEFVCITSLAYLGAHARPVEVGRTWVIVGNNIDCDWTAGEKYMQSSHPKISTVQECQKLCIDTDGCQSITYFLNSGRCSHFSTPCTKTINYSEKTVVFRLVEESLNEGMTSENESDNTLNPSMSGLKA